MFLWFTLLDSLFLYHTHLFNITHIRIGVQNLISISYKHLFDSLCLSQTSIYCFTSFSTSKNHLHFCNNFSHLFFVMCFTFYLGFYFHVFTFMSSKLHCYFSDYNRSLIQLSYSTSYTSLMCLFLFMRQILCNKLSFNIYLTSFNNSNQHLFTDTLLASFDSSYCNLFTFYFCDLSNFYFL